MSLDSKMFNQHSEQTLGQKYNFKITELEAIPREGRQERSDQRLWDTVSTIIDNILSDHPENHAKEIGKIITEINTRIDQLEKEIEADNDAEKNQAKIYRLMKSRNLFLLGEHIELAQEINDHGLSAINAPMVAGVGYKLNRGTDSFEEEDLSRGGSGMNDTILDKKRSGAGIDKQLGSRDVLKDSLTDNVLLELEKQNSLPELSEFLLLFPGAEKMRNQQHVEIHTKETADDSYHLVYCAGNLANGENARIKKFSYKQPGKGGFREGSHMRLEIIIPKTIADKLATAIKSGKFNRQQLRALMTEFIHEHYQVPDMALYGHKNTSGNEDEDITPIMPKFADWEKNPNGAPAALFEIKDPITGDQMGPQYQQAKGGVTATRITKATN